MLLPFTLSPPSANPEADPAGKAASNRQNLRPASLPRTLRQMGTRRKDLLRVLLTLPLLWPLASMLQRQEQRRQPGAAALPAELPLGLSVAGAVVAHRSADGQVRAWSARCTHLGCRIDRVIDNQLVCPCHGSRFSSEGQVITGPATRPLQALKVSPDPTTGGWSVEVG